MCINYGKQYGTENIGTEMSQIMLCNYNKEIKIYTFISIIVKSFNFACKYVEKHPFHLNANTKLSIARNGKTSLH